MEGLAGKIGKSVQDVKTMLAVHFGGSDLAEAFFSAGAILVEGATDAVILRGLMRLWEFELSEHSIAVVVAGGKPAIRIKHALLELFGIPTYCIADADCKIGDNSSNIDKRSPVYSRCQQTNNLAKYLGTSDKNGTDFSFGDLTCIGPNFSFWQDDLEAELENWNSFKTSLERAGGRLVNKKPAEFEAAIDCGGIADIPDSMRDLAKAIRRKYEMSFITSRPHRDMTASTRE